jgi:hypothetical protein
MNLETLVVVFVIHPRNYFGRWDLLSLTLRTVESLESFSFDFSWNFDFLVWLTLTGSRAGDWGIGFGIPLRSFGGWTVICRPRFESSYPKFD